MEDPLSQVWAKSPHGSTEGESLTAHTAQVLSRLAGWRERYPDLPRHTSRSDLWDIGAWACLLHDVGKVAPGFQSMLRGGPPYSDRHEALSLVAVGWLDVDDSTIALVAAGVATHHRDKAMLFEMYPPSSAAVSALLNQLVSVRLALRAWLDARIVDPVRWGFAPLPNIQDLPPQAAFNRAMRALELLGEEIQLEPGTTRHALAVRAVRGLVLLADHSGSAHERLVDSASVTSVAAFSSQLGPTWVPHPHQRDAAGTSGNALLVAPTGSGKTEAAFLWAAHQRESSSGSANIFYVLPYRASLNAMHARIRDRYGVSANAVVLQHASATAALYKYLLEDKRYTPESAARVAKHQANLARLMTSPIRVLTPYQLLRAFFGLRGHEAVVTDAAGGLFVLDELHAYDLARLALVLATVGHLARDLGARFFAMSATFPTVLREALVDAIGGAITEIRASRDLENMFRRHTLRILERDLAAPGTVLMIEERARRGEAVLVVTTTVGRAQVLYDQLRARLGDAVWMLHARFTADDRATKEAELARRVGTGLRHASSGTVLVATQVVEVSLDVDFDVLFTDPAPIESLIQRFGRVNRGRRGRLRDVFVCTAAPAEGRFVYETAHVLRAVSILRPYADSAIEESNIQQWVDTAYAPIADSWRTAIKTQMNEVRETVIAANHPLDSHEDLRDRFDQLFDGQEVVPECFANQYANLLHDEPLEASFLRVPVSFDQWMSLRRSGRLTGDRNEIARVPYSVERGLDLGARDDNA